MYKNNLYKKIKIKNIATKLKLALYKIKKLVLIKKIMLQVKS